MPGLPSSVVVKCHLFITTVLLSVFVFSPYALCAQGVYGLEFAGKKIAQELRTSLNLFPDKPLTVKDNLDLSFDLSFAPGYDSYFGYIFRITNEQGQNTDLIYSNQTQSINLVSGDEYTGILFKFPPSEVAGKWYHLQFTFNQQTRITTLRINGQVAGMAALPASLGKQLHIIFGANHYKYSNTYDLPTMRLRDVQIAQGGKTQYHWALRQHDGDRDIDLINHSIAEIEHPVWLAKAYSEWTTRQKITANGNAGLTFDKEKGILYITASDSIYQFTCNGNKLTALPLAQPRKLASGNVTEYDSKRHQLMNYFVDDQQVAWYDDTQRTWSKTAEGNKITGFWQHNHFYSSYDSSLYVFGGYGHYHYTAEIQKYSTTDDQWKTVVAKGDKFAPRYMAALGATDNGDSAYILGGHGSATGDQLLNPENFYDLLLFDVKRHTFKKIFTLDKPDVPMAFGNSMVVDTKEHAYYALAYANDRMESSLQLIKGSLDKPGYIKLGNEIPYQFYDIKSTASLYYYAKGQELIAVSLYTTDNNTTEIKINTILFPPALLMPDEDEGERNYQYLLWGIVILTTLLTGILLRRKKQEQVAPVSRIYHLPEPPKIAPAFRILELPAPVEKKKAAVYLLGQFTVIDKERNDVSKLFSPLVKELFLLIFLHSSFGRKGISSEKINEILWTGRSVKDAKNNRSVNMVKLKNILEKLGDYSLAKENGKWKLSFDEEVYVDIRHCHQLILRNNIPQLVQVCGRGGLLMETDYSWLDKFKSDLSTELLNIFTRHLDEHAEQLAPEELIQTCDSMLHFDSLCEEAVMYKCRALVAMHQHATARSLFRNFKNEYEEIYGEPFEKDYMAVMVND
ncbi:Kelch repeat-containing protein [Chitinophaga sancti]|uniref:Kelch repeat-containing protein n=1 Tax=Chitinophaga sancti TaxID=1004 RepID=UPI003F7A3646